MAGRAIRIDYIQASVGNGRWWLGRLDQPRVWTLLSSANSLAGALAIVYFAIRTARRLAITLDALAIAQVASL
jgi:hypothetical protein